MLLSMTIWLNSEKYVKLDFESYIFRISLLVVAFAFSSLDSQNFKEKGVSYITSFVSSLTLKKLRADVNTRSLDIKNPVELIKPSLCSLIFENFSLN